MHKVRESIPLSQPPSRRSPRRTAPLSDRCELSLHVNTRSEPGLLKRESYAIHARDRAARRVRDRAASPAWRSSCAGPSRGSPRRALRATRPRVRAAQRRHARLVSRLAPSTRSRRYCLITPCRDEAHYARRTLDAVTGQTVPPALWVIVDDGSKDETPKILAEYAARFPFIKIVRRADRGDRKLGGGVIDAFYAGYDSIDPDEFEYVCKLDLDLDLPPRYFELAMDWMEADPRIGTCSRQALLLPRRDPGRPDGHVPALQRQAGSSRRSAATRTRSG